MQLTGKKREREEKWGKGEGKERKEKREKREKVGGKKLIKGKEEESVAVKDSLSEGR